MVIDSSVWIEIFLEESLSKKCENEILSMKTLWVPSVTLYEVYKKLKNKLSQEIALSAMGAISKYPVCDLTREVALLAGDISIEYSMGIADSLVLAHARHLGLQLLTLDNDFSKIQGVKVLRRN